MTAEDQTPKTKGQKQIDWRNARRVLVVRLRSIGDTVLATPSLIALRRFLPDAEIDILLEDWVAPLLEGHDAVDNIITTGKSFTDKIKAALKLSGRKYDVVFNLHGGSTSTFLTRATGAKHRVGYQNHRYSFLYTDVLSSPSDFWKRERTHSAEQQLALLGFVGVPVEDKPSSSLEITRDATASLARRLVELQFDTEGKVAVIHPLAAFASKQWAAEKFAEVIENLHEKGIRSIAVGSQNERPELEKLRSLCTVPVWISENIDLPETTALLSHASLFVGNDSGIAHMAAAMNVPSVVIFGSMNRDHWYPWTDAPAEMVFHELSCQPCPGYECKMYGEPKCILSVTTEQVTAAIDRVLAAQNGRRGKLPAKAPKS